MNYAKIYEDLIESRKLRPKLEGEYYEHHHILPRCMGGGDEPENLVYLTGEDHFMAHMLLARVYGGKLWLAARAMYMKRKAREVRHRRAFAEIKRKAYEARIEACVKHRFLNTITGEEYYCIQEEMATILGAAQGNISLLVNGKLKSIKSVVMLTEEYLKYGYVDNRRKPSSKAKTVYCSNGMIFRSCEAAGVWLTQEYGATIRGTYVAAVCRGDREAIRGLNFSYSDIFSLTKQNNVCKLASEALGIIRKA